MQAKRYSWQGGRVLGTLLILLGCAAASVFLIAAQFEPDMQPLSPIDGSRDVHPARAMKVRITNAAMLHKDIVVSLRKHDDGEVPVSVVVDASEHLVSIKPHQPLERSTPYTLCLSHASKTSLLHNVLGDRLAGVSCASFTTRGIETAQAADDGAAVLVVAGRDNPYSGYYGEILKAEGLNLFHTVSEDQFNATELHRYAVVLLAVASLPQADTTALRSWVEDGGSLVAMRPDDEILEMLCLARSGTPLRRAYLRAEAGIETVSSFAGHPLQIHGEVDRQVPRAGCETTAAAGNAPGRAGTGADASGPAASKGVAPVTVAQLFKTPHEPLSAPAITQRRMGRGTVIAYAFDLARSVVYTRQGNPDWANQDRDGSAPRRPNDLFFPDYLDRSLIGVPQADEQQRLLANLIVSASPVPLPRFWYLPANKKAAIIMVGDDHATRDGTRTLFAKLEEQSAPDCRMDRWECLRATALISPRTDIASSVVKAFHDKGFEFGVHVDTNCKNQGAAQLEATLREQMSDFRLKYPFLGEQLTQRLHCIVWNGWTESAQTQNSVGIRFDMNYYNWPPAWLGGQPGFMTGSGMPMPFVTEDGDILDIYQAATQLVNEDKVPQVEGARTMIERAMGTDQFFSAFVAHYDFSDDYDDILINLARQAGVPLISAAQMLTWVDGRNRSHFTEIGWQDGILRFNVDLSPGAEQARVLLPFKSPAGQLASIRCSGEPVDFVVQNIKGLPSANAPARQGTCEATYADHAG